MNEERRRKWIVIGSLGLLLVVTVALTWPLILHMDTHVVGHLDHPGLQGDLFFQWNIGRQMEAGEGLDYLGSPFTRYPEGQRFRAKVAFSLHLALYTFFMVFTDLLTARNLAVLLVLFLNAAAAWRLAWERFRSPVFAMVFALLFAFSPFVYLKLNQGFLQKATLFYLPLFVLFFLRLLEKHRLRDAVGSAVFFSVGMLVYPPSAVFTSLLGLALLFGTGMQSLRWRSLVRPLAFFCLCVLPCVLTVLVVGKNDFVMAHRMQLDLESFRSQGGYLDLLHPFRFFPYLGTFPGSPTRGFIEELPLGLPLLPLALAVTAAVFARRRFAGWLLGFSMAVAVVMAGPYLMNSGQLVEFGGRVVALPLLLLDRLPAGQAFRFPIRLFPWLQLALLLAAGEGFLWLKDRMKAWARFPRVASLAPFLVGLVMLAEPRLLFPEYGTFHTEALVEPSYCRVPCIQNGDAVLHLPYFAPGIHRYQFEAVLCDVAMMNPVKRAPSPVAIPPADASDRQKRRFLEVIAENGVRSIVVHPDLYRLMEENPYADAPSLGPVERALKGDDVAAWLEHNLGPPLLPEGSGVLVFEVNSLTAPQ
ncbi:MAG: glycosyltransferase family 39 protein [Acidobacteriota bacterium]